MSNRDFEVVQDAARLLRDKTPNVAETLERVAAQLQSDAKRFEESQKLQDIGRNAYACIAEMVAALECDYDRLEELRAERDALKERFRLAKCDDGTYDTIDSESDEPGYVHHNLGTPGDEASAWAALFALEMEYAELAELEKAAGDCSDRDDAERRIHEDPLSIEITGTWTADNAAEPKWSDAYKVRAEILLGTGGPATRIVCELDEHMEPHRAWLQAQDWFLPWTDYVGGDGDTLLTYCQQFYFGEG